MQKELLSAYMDGEEVSAELTKQLCQDKDSQKSKDFIKTLRFEFLTKSTNSRTLLLGFSDKIFNSSSWV